LDWLTDLDGVPLVKDIASNVRKLDGFNTRHDDIYIVSYPKSGETDSGVKTQTFIKSLKWRWWLFYVRLKHSLWFL